MSTLSAHPGLNRTTTSSTSSTIMSSASPAATSWSTIPPSSRTSPKIMSPTTQRAHPSRTNSDESSRTPPSATSQATAGAQELDTWGYLYSLRVAALQQRLKASASPAPAPSAPASPHVSRFSVSSAGSRLTMNGFNGGGDIPPPEADNTLKHKRSSLRISIGGGKNDTKLPKEFLHEFWGQLSAEDGDVAWRQAVANFLLLIQKKGTKTANNANMREIPAFLQTFSTCLPPVVPNTASHQDHRAHLLHLLYHALPVSTYFVSSKSDKDKNLLLRLRAELQAQIHQSPAEAEFTPALMASGMAARVAAGNPSSGSVSPIVSPGQRPPSGPLSPLANRTQNGPTSPLAPRPTSGQVHNVQRKPSPQWEGGDAADTLVDIVGIVWGVPRPTVASDLQALSRAGSLEKLYLSDLKTRLTILARSNDQASKERQAVLSGKLAYLLASFPSLTQPGSPGTGFAQASETPIEAFFTPPCKTAVFAHLERRTAEGGHTIRAAELLQHCQEIWEVESRAETQRRAEGLFRRWEASVGTLEEAQWTRRLADTVSDLALGLSPSEPIPSVLKHIHKSFLSQLAKSVHAIFPTTSAPPPPPPPWLLPILTAAPTVFIKSLESSRALSDLADEIRGAAVGEYVMAAGEMGIHQYEVGSRTGESGKDAVVEGFEKLALWLEAEVANVSKVWGRGLGSDLDPAAIILHKQLSLFLAEIQVLETAPGSSSDVFVLYEITARLLALWARLLPGHDHGFEIDSFFEPHVITWLRETEVNETHQWVARTIGMDQWIPEGDGRFSQSVTDLFEFIRNSTQHIRDLPLSEYKRSVFLIDMSKTAAIAVSEYAKSVHMLFQTDMAPKVAAAKEAPVQNMSMGGKAGAWLAKGRHAVQKVEQKLGQNKVDGFVVPPAALVKLTNMGAAMASLEDVGYFMEADECARVIREHRLTEALDTPKTHHFSITVLRGQNILTRGGKPADALVTITDKETGERLFKSRTVLESEDPKWEQTFEVVIRDRKTLDLEALDRQLVGKHDVIGTRAFKLDPSMFSDIHVRDIVLPLSPRGVVHLRVSLDASSVYDVSYHLASASRVLENTVSDMVLEIVDQMAEFIRSQLSRSTLNTVTKPLRDKKRGRIALTEVEIDNSLTPLFDYLDENFAAFNSTLTNDTRLVVMLAVWRRIVDILMSLVIPPLSETPAPNVALSGPEVDIVFKWLQQIKAFFNAAENGVEHGVPMAALQAGGYKDMLLVGQYLDLPTPALRERAAAAVRAASSVTGAAPSSPTTGMQALSLTAVAGAGSSRSRAGEDNERMADVMLRILRMRPDTTEFLQTQLRSLLKGKVDRQGSLLQ